MSLTIACNSASNVVAVACLHRPCSLQSRHNVARTLLKAWRPYRLQQRNRLFSTAGDVPTTDATFRYRKFPWETSLGVTHEYEYVVAQQPAGGETANRDALSALEANLPRPPSGWSVLLLPSVSLACAGKEEMRPLAAGLSQRGHRCYILEWPGWTADASANWVMARCKPEALSGEYEDFWCQVLAHVAASEASEAAESSNPVAPRLCIIGAGHSTAYALKALRRLRKWSKEDEALPGVECYAALSLLSPTWLTRRKGLLSYLEPARACRMVGTLLHSESRMTRWYRELHFSKRHFRRQLALSGDQVDHFQAVASWLFERPRPYIPTDGAVMHGLLDLQMNDEGTSTSPEEFAEEVRSCTSSLEHGVFLLLPRSSSSSDSQEAISCTVACHKDPASSDALATALTAWGHGRASADTPRPIMPQESSHSAVLWAIESWLAKTAQS